MRKTKDNSLQKICTKHSMPLPLCFPSVIRECELGCDVPQKPLTVNIIDNALSILGSFLHSAGSAKTRVAIASKDCHKIKTQQLNSCGINSVFLCLIQLSVSV